MTKISSLESLGLENIDSLGDLIESAACKWGNRTGMVFDEYNEHLTFNDINEKTNNIANSLKKIGVKPKDHIAVMIKNKPEFPLSWLALSKIGATMVPINVFSKEYDAQFILEQSDARMVIADSEFISLLKRIKPSIQKMEKIISINQCDEEGVYNLFELQKSVSSKRPKVSVYPETVVNIQYTSGTTGRPKGCVLTHSYWLSAGKQNALQPNPRLNKNDVLLTAQPFYYIDPQWNVITSLITGAKLIVLDRFSPSVFWDKIREYKVTYFYCLGIMPLLLLKMPKTSYDLDNEVRHISCSAIPVHLHKKLEERWGVPWFEFFGLTETGGDISITDKEYKNYIGTGCIGRPLPHREVRVIDEHGQVLPRGEMGELIIRGKGMMEGYYKDLESTREVFRNGFFHTGDLVYMNEEGLIFYVGRQKEMIRRSEENISATEIEDVLKMHPAVSYVAVIPVPDDIRGEEVKASIVLKENMHKDSDLIKKIIDFCTEKLAYFKVPRYWEIRENLPRTPSEKIAKHKLISEKEDLRIDSYDRVDNVWR